MKIRKYLFAGLAVGAAVMALSGCGNKAEVRMTDYVEIHFSGLDGEGKVDAYIDKGSLKRDILAQVYEEKEDLSDKKLLEDLGDYEGFENSITCELDKEEGLKNGDKVTLSISCDEETAEDCGIRIAGDLKKTYEVEGLTERIELDAFDSKVFNTEEGIEISFSGRAPFGRISIENHFSRSETLSDVRYTADKTENIKEGDKITITAELSAGLEVDGYYLKKNSTVVTVENIDRYLSDQMEPGMWEQIEPYCDQEITDELNGTFFIMDGEDSYRFDKDDVLSFEGITYGTEAYLATCRAADGREAYNMLLVPYYIHATLPGGIRLGENETATGYAMIENVIQTKEGTIDTEAISVRLPDSSYTSLAQADSRCLGEIRTNYDLVPITLQ